MSAGEVGEGPVCLVKGVRDRGHGDPEVGTLII